MLQLFKYICLIVLVVACSEKRSSRSVEVGDRIIRYSFYSCEVRTFSMACGAGEMATVPGCMTNCTNSGAQCVSGSISFNCATSASSCYCD